MAQYRPVNHRKELFNALEMTTESADSFAPTLIFVVLMAFNVLGLGSAFANKDGKIAPRSGCALLGLGAAKPSRATMKSSETSFPCWRHWTNGFVTFFCDDGNRI